MIAAESRRKPAWGWRLTWVPLAVALLVLGWVGLRREPSYQGRSLGAWLTAAQFGEETAAAEAIEMMGDRCLPGLVRRLGSVDSRLRGWLQPVLGERGVSTLLGPEARHLRAQAAWGFQQLGARAAPALPSLLPLVLRSDCSASTLDAVVAVGEPAVPALIEWLSRPELGRHYLAAVILGRMGPKASAAAPGLMACLGDSSKAVCGAAAMALGDIGHAGRPAVPQLEMLLARTPGATDLDAAYALSRLEGDGWVALLRAVSSPSRGAQVAGAAGLAFQAELRKRHQVAGARSGGWAVQSTRRVFQSTVAQVRNCDPARLQHLAAAAAVSLVSDPNVRVRRQLAESLREWPVDTEPVRQALDTLRRDPDAGVRRAAGGYTDSQ